MFSENNSDIINIDQLIPRINFYIYLNKSTVFDIKNDGLLTTKEMISHYPNRQSEIRNVYPYYNDLVDNSVICYANRIPETPKTKKFLSHNSIVSISLNKLKASKSKYKFFTFSKNKEIKKLSFNDYYDMNDNLDIFYNQVKNSKDPYFRDVDRILIFGHGDSIQSFACKIIDNKG